MKEYLKKAIGKFKENPVQGLVLVVYFSGFFIWNYYLNSFGFFEYNIVQVRYFSAGILYLVACIFPISFIYILLIHFFNKPNQRKILICVAFAGWFFWSIYFINYFFPQIPQYWGGIRPLPVSIIASPEQIRFLSNFDIASAQNGSSSPVQTGAVCLVYQNDEYILVFNVSDVKLSTSTRSAAINGVRAIEIHRDSFSSIQSMNDPGSSNPCELSSIFYNGRVKIRTSVE